MSALRSDTPPREGRAPPCTSQIGPIGRIRRIGPIGLADTLWSAFEGIAHERRSAAHPYEREHAPVCSEARRRSRSAVRRCAEVSDRTPLRDLLGAPLRA